MMNLNGSYSVSDVLDCIEYIIKKHETTTISPIHDYINRINKRLVLKTKDGHNLKLQTPFGSIKK